MSLTLARLCGEWRLVSEIYGARSEKYKACIVIIRIPTADYFIAEYHDFSRKYEAQIAIFCILAADYFIAEYRDFGREIRSSDSDLLYICRHR